MSKNNEVKFITISNFGYIHTLGISGPVVVPIKVTTPLVIKTIIAGYQVKEINPDTNEVRDLTIDNVNDEWDVPAEDLEDTKIIPDEVTKDDVTPVDTDEVSEVPVETPIVEVPVEDVETTPVDVPVEVIEVTETPVVEVPVDVVETTPVVEVVEQAPEVPVAVKDDSDSKGKNRHKK